MKTHEKVAFGLGGASMLTAMGSDFIENEALSNAVQLGAEVGLVATILLLLPSMSFLFRRRGK